MKKLLALLLTAGMVLSLAACGASGTESSSAPESSQAPESTAESSQAQPEASSSEETPAPAESGLSGEITFMVLDSFNKDYNPLQEATDAFMVANPGVKVTIEYVSSNDIREKFNTAAMGGSGPDVVSLDSAGWAVDAAAAGLLAPLDSDVSAIADQFYPGPLNSGMFNGSYYAVPWYMNNEGMYYNKAILEECGIEAAPTNWEELLDACQKAVDKGYGGIMMPYYFPSYYIYPFFYQAGCPIIDTTGTPTSALMTDEGKEAWAYLAELAKIGAYPEAIKDASSWDTTYAPFLQGKCAFLFCGDWAVWSLMDSDVDYGIAPMPAGKQPATLMGGYTLSINKNTKNYDAAWAYVEWLTAAEQNYVLQGYGRISARQDGDTASIIADSPHEEQFIAQLDSTYPRPAIINQAELDEMVSEAYRQVILGADPDQTLADLDANVTAFLEEFYG